MAPERGRSALDAVMLMGKAMGNPALADRVANGFDEPATILPLFADPAQAAAA